MESVLVSDLREALRYAEALDKIVNEFPPRCSSKRWKETHERFERAFVSAIDQVNLDGLDLLPHTTVTVERHEQRRAKRASAPVAGAGVGAAEGGG